MSPELHVTNRKDWRLWLFYTAFISLFVGQTFALDMETSQKLDKVFSDAGINGTFVLYDVTANRLVVHAPIRAEKRFIPASTFKIPNSLIGLSTGAVGSVDEAIPYGGKPQPIKAWEADMGLRDAITISNVPVYQELARRIGLENMREKLAQIPYGNNETGNKVDRFWLEGPLKISAVEQTIFLARLARGDLPFRSDIQQSVREIILLEQKSDQVLYGKTGWTSTPTPDIGWWVGWVEKENRIYSFAINIDMPNRADVAKRVEIGKVCLRTLGIL